MSCTLNQLTQFVIPNRQGELYFRFWYSVVIIWFQQLNSYIASSSVNQFEFGFKLLIVYI